MKEVTRTAASWTRVFLKEYIDKVSAVTASMCSFGAVSGKGSHNGLAKKDTGCMTNSNDIVPVLNEPCTNEFHQSHRHSVPLADGPAKAAQKYPKGLIIATMKGLNRNERRCRCRYRYRGDTRQIPIPIPDKYIHIYR